MQVTRQMSVLVPNTTVFLWSISDPRVTARRTTRLSPHVHNRLAQELYLRVLLVRGKQ